MSRRRLCAGRWLDQDVIVPHLPGNVCKLGETWRRTEMLEFNLPLRPVNPG
ncbi:hypothetical protein V474_13550 [Novosphingobium barchaimii LL02]|uniref:Uncharacterized protein n=1 Tax=Novosphingobium barchaimii LL02 TaxID=1114963 RepID=A0A0J8ANF2_9SPHN|nr:hypothetical protein V474_13550 [Novosphingobium barchaimii LL02]